MTRAPRALPFPWGPLRWAFFLMESQEEENLEKEEARNSHKALLQLGRNRDGRLQLVTTNFDRLFHLASQNDKTLEFASCGAPLLPIPKKNHWDGLVFLHGLLPENCDEVGLNNLVVTSGDFGLAYLLERWAARFISELFHHYTVCFVGYSLNDPPYIALHNRCSGR